MRYLKTSETTIPDSRLVQVFRQAAHDIRSPLSALNLVIGTTETLCEERREILREAIARINKIAEDLLSVKAGQEPSHFQAISDSNYFRAQSAPLDAIKLLEGAVSLKATETAAAKTKFIKNFDNVENAIAYGDVEMLKRVLSNVFNNSLEAGSRTISVNVMSDETSILIAIEDDGTGIPKNILEQLESGKAFSYGKGIQGNGLGMSHARKAIHAMHGDVTITSREGEGTCLTIRLPRA